VGMISRGMMKTQKDDKKTDRRNDKKYVKIKNHKRKIQQIS
jgi:hypothetical protein